MKNLELSWEIYLLQSDHAQVSWNELPEKEKQNFCEELKRMLSEKVSEYYREHLEEYERICK